MFFKTFTSTCFAIALTSSAVSAISAVTQEDAMPTATEEFLSQTLTEGESGSGGVFGRSKEPIWNYYEKHSKLWLRESEDVGPASDAEKIRLIAFYGGVETYGYKRIGRGGAEVEIDEIIANVDKASQKWASDTMQRLAREIKYLIKDTDCAEAGAATTREQKETFAQKFLDKMLKSQPSLEELIKPFKTLSAGSRERSGQFGKLWASIRGVADWNNSPFQFEDVASLEKMKSALLSPTTIMFLSSSFGREGTNFEHWAERIFMTMFQSVCPAENQAWGDPGMSFF